jgi:hypothetical protein
MTSKKEGVKQSFTVQYICFSLVFVSEDQNLKKVFWYFARHVISLFYAQKVSLVLKECIKYFCVFTK